jgi:hypothetical protein
MAAHSLVPFDFPERAAMKLSSTVSNIALSPTIAMSTRAAELRAQGHDVIVLNTGEPDFDTPANTYNI